MNWRLNTTTRPEEPFLTVKLGDILVPTASNKTGTPYLIVTSSSAGVTAISIASPGEVYAISDRAFSASYFRKLQPGEELILTP